MDRQEILLKEYETCQSVVNSIGSLFWIIVGVFMAINTALLGALLYVFLQRGGLQIIFKDYPTHSELLQLRTLALVIVALGVGMIMVLVFLKRYHRRTRWLVRVARERMLEIENELGIWQGWIVFGLDRMDKSKGYYDFKDKAIKEADNVHKEARDKLLTYHPLEWWQKMRELDEYSGVEGFRSVRCIFSIFIAMWAVVVVAALVAAIFVH
jgi:hypothetical protein